MTTKKIKQFITRCYNQSEDNYCWYNTSNLLTKEEISDLHKYFIKQDYKYMLIINGCSQLRPQRTWCTLPTFLKGLDGFHRIFKSQSNAFILCSWLKYYDGYYDDRAELIKGLSYDLDITIFEK